MPGRQTGSLETETADDPDKTNVIKSCVFGRHSLKEKIWKEKKKVSS